MITFVLHKNHSFKQSVFNLKKRAVEIQTRDTFKLALHDSKQNMHPTDSQVDSSHQALSIPVLARQANVATYIHIKGGKYKQHHVLH